MTRHIGWASGKSLNHAVQRVRRYIRTASHSLLVAVGGVFLIAEIAFLWVLVIGPTRHKLMFTTRSLAEGNQQEAQLRRLAQQFESIGEELNVVKAKLRAVDVKREIESNDDQAFFGIQAAALRADVKLLSFDRVIGPAMETSDGSLERIVLEGEFVRIFELLTIIDESRSSLEVRDFTAHMNDDSPGRVTLSLTIDRKHSQPRTFASCRTVR